MCLRVLRALERSLKEAASELKARLSAGHDRRFPFLGLKGAANAFALREAALSLERPILAITAQARDAEALANELSFFLEEPANRDPIARRVQQFRAWDLKPFAFLSPPIDIQSAQFASLYSLLRTPAPIVVTSVEAVMTRTVTAAAFAESILKIEPAELLDLEMLVETLAHLGYQRVPQAEELGDFSVRGGIIDIFSPLYRDPMRIELEDDVVLSIRRFESSSQRSLGEVDEVILVQTRYIAPGSLKNGQLIDRVALRAAEIGLV
ncbi:MAG: hypothetical protein ACREP6_14040, partial [Candidatus Binataceae bacterium]